MELYNWKKFNEKCNCEYNKEEEEDIKYNSNDELSDDENPEFLFDLTHHSILRKIIKGEIDCIELAKNQLRKRGYSIDNE